VRYWCHHSPEVFSETKNVRNFSEECGRKAVEFFLIYRIAINRIASDSIYWGTVIYRD
jgi:hypothetical protein